MQLIILAEPQQKETEVFKKHGATRASEHREPLLDRLTQRIRDITGMKLSDRYPDANFIKYGFGGHYSSHYDFFNASNPDTEGRGDQIATVIFYVSFKSHSNSKPFTFLNISVK